MPICKLIPDIWAFLLRPRLLEIQQGQYIYPCRFASRGQSVSSGAAVTRHGVGRILHTSQAEHLASHGYIVFAVDHTYSTVMTAFPDGRKTGFLTEQSQERLFEDSRAILDVWNKDTAFIVNQLEKRIQAPLPANSKECWI